MNRKPPPAAELEAELIRLTTLVRERRKQLAQLASCPNKSCHCRLVWREQVEKQLASQVRKIRKRVSGRLARGRQPSPLPGGRQRRSRASRG